MTKTEIRTEALKLPAAERYEIAAELLESLDENAVAVPAWHLQVLAERLEAEEQDPTAGSPWPEVKERILAALR